MESRIPRSIVLAFGDKQQDEAIRSSQRVVKTSSSPELAKKDRRVKFARREMVESFTAETWIQNDTCKKSSYMDIQSVEKYPLPEML